jgi:hypothetical protein
MYNQLLPAFIFFELLARASFPFLLTQSAFFLHLHRICEDHWVAGDAAG